MTKFASTIFLSLLCCIICPAQQISQPLNIGDSLPYPVIQTLLSKAIPDQQHTSLLENKVVILDFWNIWCAACIKSFPDIDSLQHTFSKDLQFILVTQNTTEQVNDLFKRIKTPRPGVLFINSDSILNKWFPHQGDPLHVWINKEGKVQYITYGYNATETHINNMLKGEALRLARRDDENINFQEPIISESNSFLIKEVTAYSTIARLYPFTGDNQIIIKRDSVTGDPVFLRVMNAPILKLFQIAYGKDLFGTEINVNRLLKNNRMLIKMHDQKALFYPNDKTELDTWQMENLYSYEIKIPAGSGTDLYRMMQQDLNRYLKVKGTLEKRWKNCLVLVRDNKSVKIKDIDNTITPSFSYSNDSSVIRNNTISSTLLKQLIYLNSNKAYPIIDGTRYSKPVDMTLHSPLNSIPLLKKELKQYGLDLRMERREINMLIVTDQ